MPDDRPRSRREAWPSAAPGPQRGEGQDRKRTAAGHDDALDRLIKALNEAWKGAAGRAVTEEHGKVLPAALERFILLVELSGGSGSGGVTEQGLNNFLLFIEKWNVDTSRLGTAKIVDIYLKDSFMNSLKK